MSQNNTIFDLIQRITDLLQNGRLQVVYNVAKKPELSPRLRDTFIKLAAFVQKKNAQIDQTAKINKCYRQCINKILDFEQFGQDSLSNQYEQIPKDILKNIIRLKDFIQSILKQMHEQQEKIKKTKQNYEQFQLKFQEKKSLVNKHEQQIQVLKKQKKENESGINQLKKMQEQNKQLTGDLKVSKDIISQLTQQISKLNQIVKKKGEEQKNKGKIEQQLKQNERQLQEVKDKLHLQKSQTKQLKEQLNLKSNLINQLREQVNSKSQQLKKVNQQFKSKLSQIQQSKIINSESNILSSIFQKSNNQYKMADSLTDKIQNLKKKSIKGIQRLYTFKLNKKQSFHQFIAGKFNILLVCLTQDGSLIGGFTSASFSLNDEANNTKAFLFAMQNGKYSFNQLKRGKASVEYDLDFLIFGNEQLCLQRGKCQISSYSSSLESQSRHYDFSAKQNYFQKLIEPEGRIALKNYQIFQINLDE